MIQQKPKVLWILMFENTEGVWLPSIDHYCAWRTKKAALRKIQQLDCELKHKYKPFKYVIGDSQ